MKSLPIPINKGTNPALDEQVSFPRLKNGFVGPEAVYLRPAIEQTNSFSNALAIHQSTFEDRTIVVTKRQVFVIDNKGIQSKVGDILPSLEFVRLDENSQNQITIVNGGGAWVLDQRNSNLFVQLNSTDNGFDLDNPVDVHVLNTFTIIVGGTDQKWIISNANNALNYDAQDIVVTDNSLGKLSGVRSIDNNLFIFGTNGNQRWVPSIERLPSDAPFSQDPNYRDDFGAISTASLKTGNNVIYFLDKESSVRALASNSARSVSLMSEGQAEFTLKQGDISKTYGSYYYFRGNYFYQLSFEKNSLVFCLSSKTWSESDLIFRDYDGQALLEDGVYDLTQDYSKEWLSVELTAPYMNFTITDPMDRVTLHAVFLNVTQGKENVVKGSRVDLQLSKDNVCYGNRVSRDLAPQAERLRQLRWHLNVANNAFAYRLTLHLKSDISIISALAFIE